MTKLVPVGLTAPREETIGCPESVTVIAFDTVPTVVEAGCPVSVTLDVPESTNDP
jgi:hypothetical protein